MVITRLLKTCEACPSQWEGTLEDGRMVYIRYRWGWLTIHISEGPTTSIFDAVRAPEAGSFQLGDSLDGDLSEERMKEYAQLVGLEF